MSKIGKINIAVPEKVKVALAGNNLNIEGPLGKKSIDIDLDIFNLDIKDGKEISIKPKHVNDDTKRLWGMHRSLLNNAIIGASNGYEKVLELSGVGYRAALKDKNLNCFKALSEELNTSQSIKKIGLSPVNKSMLRAQMTLHNENNQEIGNITSGCYSPILKKSIAIGYINKSLDMSEKLFVKIRDKLEEIQIEKIPFVKKNYKKGD
jgi:ribosomal protein L6P/L9E